MARNSAKIALAASAMFLVAACNSDGSSFGGGGGGGGGTPSSITSLGVTGEGGVTETLGIAALTDPLLGTEGVLGGGGEGAIGGQLPAELTDAIAPLRDGLAPVVDTVGGSVPVGTVTDQIPSLGIGGEGGLVYDLAGQDPVGMLLGGNGTVPMLLGGGNDGALGDVVPAGAVPGLPGGGDGGDPLAPITDLLGGGLPGLPGGGDDPLAPVTDLLGGAGGLGVTGDGGVLSSLLGDDPVGPAITPLGPVADLLGGGSDGLLGSIVPADALPGGGGDDPLAPVTDLLGGLPALPGS
ncbi:putative membrane protein, glycine-rich [Parvibaculum lavamentivorans DS-1]|uniref:Putative membrane protein, glycine-rich n=1 Tax=Parvibaculum lavamentivorans (strain DS-1 / DSM 13023 / NCIMB 13966) TaxID=402881 RepID=A7HP75_PARL1|nr:hypothetical protein [Parvibaculum lavamentivorans]ABS61708.1 putative membrane protein, glycine-rich [Parvibaculum lavamentivorans DS-1]